MEQFQSFIDYLSSYPDWAKWTITICIIISISILLLTPRNTLLDNKTSQDMNIKSHYKIFRSGEVGKRVLPYNDKILILSELREPETNKIKLTISRINKDGSNDATFGNSGKVILDFEGSENSQSGQIVLDKKRNIYVVAHSIFENKFKIVVAKLLPSGHFDTSYGNNGIAMASTMGNGGHEYAMNATIHTDGSIITIGHQFGTKNLLLSKFNQDGTLNTSFGNNGFVSFSFSSEHDWGVSLLVTAPENKILALFNSGNRKPSIIRLNFDGTVDTTFGRDGVVSLTDFLDSTNLMKVTSMDIQEEGKILVSGYGNQGIIIRLNSEGTLDTDFAQSGKKIVRGQFRTSINKVISDPEGRIFVAGEQSDGNSLMNGLIASFDKEGSPVLDFGDNGYIFIKDDVKLRVTDIEFFNKSELVIIGEESAMSNGFESTFFKVITF